MHLLSTLKYFVAEIPKAPKITEALNAAKELPTQKKEKNKGPKVNIKPVKIDFPLPGKVQGIEHRLNSKNTYLIPDMYFKKNEPEYLVGKTIRLYHLMSNPENFIDQVITVSGWAREARLQGNDTLLFIKLVDGSNTTPLQVVI